MTQKWAWQDNNWPSFKYDNALIDPLENTFWCESGKLWGATAHLSRNNQMDFRIGIMSDEAIFNADIEGDFLDRDCVQRSLKRHFGLEKHGRDLGMKHMAADGMVDMMLDMHGQVELPLSEKNLLYWHALLFAGREYNINIGSYRTGAEPMQIVSGSIYAPKVHYEAPPSGQLRQEMQAYVAWYNQSMCNKKASLPPLTRAAIAHLYFELIHPFEDGNGRIGRVLVEKVLGQALGYPALIALSSVLQLHQKRYYAAIAAANTSLDITEWILFFSEMILESIRYSCDMVVFFIHKTRTMMQFKNQLNMRQIKVLNRMYAAGPNGFIGGLSAGNYSALTRASRATVTRDLSELVGWGILTKVGERRHSRYTLSIQFGMLGY